MRPHNKYLLHYSKTLGNSTQISTMIEHWYCQLVVNHDSNIKLLGILLDSPQHTGPWQWIPCSAAPASWLHTASGRWGSSDHRSCRPREPAWQSGRAWCELVQTTEHVGTSWQAHTGPLQYAIDIAQNINHVRFANHDKLQADVSVFRNWSWVGVLYFSNLLLVSYVCQSWRRSVLNPMENKQSPW